MAGKKISELPQGTVIADNDLIPYVDVSDTSEAPTGTTKYMEKSLLDIPTSGTWTPVISGVVGAATVEAEGGAFYTIIDGMVTITGAIKCTMDALQTEEDFILSGFPEPAADFADAKKVRGSWAFGETGLASSGGTMASIGSTKTISVSIDSIAGAESIISFTLMYQL